MDMDSVWARIRFDLLKHQDAAEDSLRALGFNFCRAGHCRRIIARSRIVSSTLVLVRERKRGTEGCFDSGVQ
jgi:hypothetical protein